MGLSGICPRCGRPNVGSLSYCPGCGAALGRDSLKKHGWKVAVGGALLTLGVVWGAANLGEGGRRSEPLPLTQQQTTFTPTAPTPVPPAELTGAQHLAEAKKALAGGQRADNDQKETYQGGLPRARSHLEAIRPGSAQFSEAQRLLGEVARREGEIGRAGKLKDDGARREAEEGGGSNEGHSTSRASRGAPAATREAEARPSAVASEATVYITRTGAKYHRAGCRYLSRSQVPVTLGDAKRHYTPCSVCSPPR